MNQTAAIMEETEELTPSMRQYFEIKQRYPNEILFYQMGDFYEMFFEDALKASKILDITLTKRGKFKGAEIPMCGVPLATSEMYLERLMRADVRVAVCGQLESPEEARKRGSKAVVHRDVIRIVTPGTITEANILKASEHSFISAIAISKDKAVIASADITTAEFILSIIPPNQIDYELSRINPKEILLSDKIIDDSDSKKYLGIFLNKANFIASRNFDTIKAAQAFQKFFKISAPEVSGIVDAIELSAVGAVLEYISVTQVSSIPYLNMPRREVTSAFMQIDPATRRSLEITNRITGEKTGSLFSAIDNTATAIGSRLLLTRINSPLTDPIKINSRFDAVEYFLNDKATRQTLRKTIADFSDVERAISRIFLERATPRDLGMILNSLEIVKSVREQLLNKNISAPEIKLSLENLENNDALRAKLKAVLSDELPANTRDGGFVKTGYSDLLDEQRLMRDEGKRLIAALEFQYRERTGASSLKIRHNNILGYYIDITTTNKGKELPEFIHRQTMAGSMRFTSIELKELEKKLESAAVMALENELAIFTELCNEIKNNALNISHAAQAIASLDVYSSLAELAENQKLCRPIIDDSNIISIKDGRHPVVEKMLRKNAARFQPNSINMNPDSRIWLITGPNMGGKSTYLRQNAIIIILAQMGAYVPASSAHIGIVDKLFSRVGASDDLASGRSTFMVEMVETACILNQATAKSFVILDEIGRGTSTHDGLSIAWATLEYIHDKIGCRTLFATHYHEMSNLSEKLKGMRCYTTKAKEWNGDIILLHQIVEGNADKSYGIHVAKLAGLPAEVISNSRNILAMLEDIKLTHNNQFSLFSYSPPAAVSAPATDALRDKLASINPDFLSPKQALELLYELKAEA